MLVPVEMQQHLEAGVVGTGFLRAVRGAKGSSCEQLHAKSKRQQLDLELYCVSYRDILPQGQTMCYEPWWTGRSLKSTSADTLSPKGLEARD